MGNVQITVAAVCVIAVLLLIFFAFFQSVNFLSWVQAWIFSNKEEMVGLTKLKGHYNANGYLVHSDSDIQLNCGTGSFKRFDSVDRDFRISVASTSFMGDGCGTNYEEESSIPPQPLRPAPVPAVTSAQAAENSANATFPRKTISIEEASRTIETTSISPIPRPVSAVNVANLISQSSFPVYITPPPSPCTLGMGAFVSGTPETTVFGGSTMGNSSTPLETVRAISCDSVCSDTSVALGDLEMLNVTGYLCIGLEYDSECWDLVVNVLEAKDLCGVTKRDDFLDSYVRVTLLPDKEATIQTKVYRSTGSPSYKERFLFSMNPREQSQRLLCFHVYATDFLSHTLVGEGEIRLSDVSLRQPVTTWVTLTDTGQKGTEFGELMFSISYLPTAERLTVVVVKARSLKFRNDSDGEAFVKTIQLRLTVAETSNEENVSCYPIGHVIVGAQASGRSLSHWNQMLTALRRPVAMWHSLRK
ncbi:hypothetical protein NQ315_016562 [Exocentrus adspersus]|uniref:C2 domain-containing protein n=1 Tax=Exocentrus adspersus TaxID=1586481 RepID=A0AAV8VZY4_9CUCU|nr:hypothetical protein NQ315_016562 [Exocentrus adspersus]